MSDPQSFNPHAYVRNNPLKYVDPTGEFWFLAVAIGAVVRAAVGYVGCGLATGGWTAGTCGMAALAGAVAGAVVVATLGIGSAAVGGTLGGATLVSAGGFTGILGLGSISGAGLALGITSASAGLLGGVATFRGGMSLLDIFSGGTRAPGGVNLTNPGVPSTGSDSATGPGDTLLSLAGRRGTQNEPRERQPKKIPKGGPSPETEGKSLPGYAGGKQQSGVRRGLCAALTIGGLIGGVGAYEELRESSWSWALPPTGFGVGAVLGCRRR